MRTIPLYTHAIFSTISVPTHAHVITVHSYSTCTLATITSARFTLEKFLICFANTIHILTVNFRAAFCWSVHVEAKLAIATGSIHCVTFKIDSVGCTVKLASLGTETEEFIGWTIWVNFWVICDFNGLFIFKILENVWMKICFLCKFRDFFNNYFREINKFLIFKISTKNDVEKVSKFKKKIHSISFNYDSIFLTPSLFQPTIILTGISQIVNKTANTHQKHKNHWNWKYFLHIFTLYTTDSMTIKDWMKWKMRHFYV